MSSRISLSFCGLRQAGASEEQVYKGRRRMVTCTAFIVFVLLVAALGDEEWISGGLEYTFTNLADAQNGCASCGDVTTMPGLRVRARRSCYHAMSPATAVPPACHRPPMGPYLPLARRRSWLRQPL